MARARASGTAADFLVEIGTEELPPGALHGLMNAFGGNLEGLLGRAHLAHGEVRAFAGPRRLAVLVRALAKSQPDREDEQRGPPVAVAFDASGKPTAAATAFAAKCGVDLAALERSKTPKGEWLSCRVRQKGRPAAELLPGLVQEALDALPVPRRMRWGASTQEFVRPVHWVLMLHGTSQVDGTVLGLEAGRLTYGHRFLAPAAIEIGKPADYLGLLEKRGFVVADFAARRRRVEDGVRQAAADAGGAALGEDVLYDEVTALTEWPVALTGRFDEAFLELPREVIVATLTGHQRYFPVVDGSGRLLARFVTVANLPSKDPDKVRDGNERVVRPRLADAAFFWSQDRKKPLADRREALKKVVYQQGLGSLHDRAGRIAAVATRLADALGMDAENAERAARLAKCDLTTGMVGEFPELQGTMGRYYALASGEPAEVAEAIGEQYLPRFAGDRLPELAAGQILALADKLDNLAGAFALGKRPSGNRDPFGLRRAALGIVRISIERRLDFDLPALIATAVAAQPVSDLDAAGATRDLYDFIVERMRTWCSDRQGMKSEIFESVLARRPASLVDFDERLDAVTRFVALEPAQALAAANKRIANILRQADYDTPASVDTGLVTEPGEKALWAALKAADEDVRPMLERRAYAAMLERLAGLRDSVDSFFDTVMVMTGDDAVRRNRLALLSELRGLFLEVADVSRLAIA